MPTGPTCPSSGRAPLQEVRDLVESEMASTVVTHAVLRGDRLRVASLMRIDQGNGVIEIGWVAFGTPLQRTVSSTEAQRPLMGHVFDDLGVSPSRVEVATRSTHRRCGRPNDSATPLRGFSGRPSSPRAATGTQLGGRSPTPSGPLSANYSTSGSTPSNFDDSGQQRARLSPWAGCVSLSQLVATSARMSRSPRARTIDSRTRRREGWAQHGDAQDAVVRQRHPFCRRASSMGTSPSCAERRQPPRRAGGPSTWRRDRSAVGQRADDRRSGAGTPKRRQSAPTSSSPRSGHRRIRRENDVVERRPAQALHSLGCNESATARASVPAWSAVAG